MPTSRFWRSIVIICSILSGVYVTIRAFQAIKQRFFSGEDESENQSQSVVIMGVGLRFIAPTRVEFAEIEDALHHAPALFSRAPRRQR